MASKSEIPAKSATKDEWVGYAIDRDVPSYEAWAMTVDELHERFAPPPSPTRAAATAPAKPAAKGKAS